MTVAAYVAPLFRPNTNRFVRGFCDLPGVTVGLIGMDPPDLLDPELRARVAAFERVGDVGDPDQIAAAAASLRTRLGRLDVLATSLEELQIPVAIARDRLGLGGMSERTARNFREKGRMKDVLRAAGIAVARHRLAHSHAEALRFADEVGWPIVAKPPAGLGARATWRVEHELELAAALTAFGVGPDNPVHCEEFVIGRENTCETVVIGGRAVWHSGTRYLNAPLEVLENPWMQYCVMLPKPEGPEFRHFHAANDAALAALGLSTGLSHLEWFLRPGGRAVVSEVGARPPGANIMPLMSAAFEVDFVQKWCELTAFGTFDPPERKHSVGTAFFRGQGTGRVSAVLGLAEAQEEVGQWVIDRKLPTLGQARSPSYEGEGWAIVRADDDATVLHALRRLVSLVRIEYGG